MSKKEKDKGARAERELAKLLQLKGLSARRGYVQFRQSDLVGLFGIHVECKFVEKLNFWKAMRQAIDEAEKRKDGVPTVFAKKSYEGWVVTMKLENWIDLYKAALRGGWRSEHESERDSLTTLNQMHEEGDHERGGVYEVRNNGSPEEDMRTPE